MECTLKPTNSAAAYLSLKSLAREHTFQALATSRSTMQTSKGYTADESSGICPKSSACVGNRQQDSSQKVAQPTAASLSVHSDVRDLQTPQSSKQPNRPVLQLLAISSDVWTGLPALLQVRRQICLQRQQTSASDQAARNKARPMSMAILWNSRLDMD